MKTKRRISLTGGAGSGKSRILEILEKEYGAGTLQADRVAKEMQAPGRPGFLALRGAFGEAVVGEDGYLRRDVLAAMVFGDPKVRAIVNGLIHPLVWSEVKRWAGEVEASLLVVESALLPENPGDFFDEVWYVYTLRECRIRRLMESRGYSWERCVQMMESQPSEEAFRKAATHVIDNNGSIEAVKRQIEAIVRVWQDMGTMWKRMSKEESGR